MKITDISTYLNEAYERLSDDDIKLSSDLRNIVDFGKSITSDSTFDETFQSRLSNLIAKITKTTIHESTMNTPTPHVFTDSAGYNNAIEHILIDVPDFVANETYLYDTNTFEKLFGEEMPEVSATYYNSVLHCTNKITKSKQMYIDAFSSESSFNAYWSEVLNRIKVRVEYAKAVLSYAVFNSKVAHSMHKNNKENVIALEIPSNNDYTDFITTLKTTIRTIKDFNNYGGDGYVDSTPSNHLRLAVLGDYFDKMTTSKAYSFNDKFLDIPVSNIDVLNNFGDATEKNVIRVVTPDNTEGNETKIENVVAVLYDDRGAVAYGDNVYTDSQKIANTTGKINFFYMYDFHRAVVDGYKCIVFTEHGANDVTLNSPIENE